MRLIHTKSAWFCVRIDNNRAFSFMVNNSNGGTPTHGGRGIDLWQLIFQIVNPSVLYFSLPQQSHFLCHPISLRASTTGMIVFPLTWWSPNKVGRVLFCFYDFSCSMCHYDVFKCTTVCSHGFGPSQRFEKRTIEVASSNSELNYLMHHDVATAFVATAFVTKCSSYIMVHEVLQICVLICINCYAIR